MNNRLFILLCCLFVTMMGYGMPLPVLPFHIERMALSTGASEAEASLHVGVLTGLFALMQFLSAPLWGQWSDHLGRRPLFLAGLGGLSVSMALFGIGADLGTLYVARILGGTFAAAILTTATAYVADATSDEDRGRGMAWMGTAIGMGIVFGPAVGAFLSGFDFFPTYEFGIFKLDKFSLPFWGASLLSVLTLGAAKLWLPESLKRLSIKGPNSDKGHYVGLKPSFFPGWLSSLLALAFLSQFALAMFEGTFALHAKQRDQFGPSEMGIVFVTCGFVMAAAQAGVTGRLIERFGEKPLLPAGFVLMGLAFLMLMATLKLPFIIIHVATLALGMALLIPSLASLVSQQAGDHTGAALGKLNAANSLGQALGPAMGASLLVWQIHAPYIITGALLVATAVCITCVLFFWPHTFDTVDEIRQSKEVIE